MPLWMQENLPLLLRQVVIQTHYFRNQVCRANQSITYPQESLCQVLYKNSQNWNNGSHLKFASKLLLSIAIVSSSVTFFSNLVGNQITMIYYYFTMIYKNVTASKMLFASFFCHNCVTRSFSYKIIVNILKPPNSLSGCYF